MAEEKTRARAKERPKVDLDSAEADFDRFCKAFRLRKAMAGALDDAKDVVIQAIRGGAVTVDEKGQLNFQPGDDMDALVFHEPRGADLMAMDQKPEGHKIAALHACAASITG